MEPWMLPVKQMAASGKPALSSCRSKQFGKVSFDDLVLVPAQLARRPVDYYRENVSSETVIGKRSKRPLKLSTPLLIGAMSFGALSKEAKVALAKASRLAGTCTNTGEGGMLPEERKAARLLIAQYSTGRFGVNEKYLKSADAVEIKIGQGAKPGMGGLLPGSKVTREIAKVRGVPAGKTVHSPPAHPDIKTPQDLKKRVDWLRKVTGGRPIIIKLGAGDIENDVKIALRANPDAIAIDGLSGGTGAAPAIALDHFGIPALSALVRARRVLDKAWAKQELLIGGGLNTGADVAKALALGADAVFMCTPLLVAVGCIYCRLCQLGKCPVGITTQEPKLRKKFDPKGAQHAANFIRACTEEAKMAAAACGHKDIHKLNRKDLRSLNPTISNITGVPLV
ncbi:MAG: FMN-binding glutamate synthase family protein [Candidatus Aenigmatarchaeota archaeon]